MLPTCNVLCTIYDNDGSPVAGAIVSARLNRFEVYQGYVVPDLEKATTNAAGQCTLKLWPNQLGSTESSYDVRISAPNGKTLRTTATVPNVANTELHLISNLPAYDGKPDGQLIIDEAIAAVAPAVAAKIAAQAAQAAAEAAAAEAAAAVETIQNDAIAPAIDAKNAAQAAQAAAESAASLAGTRANAAASSASTASNAASSTAADRTQTGLDKAATAADRVQTGLDRTAASNSATAAASAAAVYTDIQASLIRQSANLIQTQTIVVNHFAFA